MADTVWILLYSFGVAAWLNMRLERTRAATPAFAPASAGGGGTSVSPGGTPEM